MVNRAFTTRHSSIVNVLKSEIEIFHPLTKEDFNLTQQPPLSKKCLAIWDTGATNSVITKEIADALGLKPTGIIEMNHAGGKSNANVYLVTIALPDGVFVQQVQVSEASLTIDSHLPEEKRPKALIGMDIIGIGDFAVTNFQGKTTLSFRAPSTKEIDLVPEAQENNIMHGGNRQQRKALEAQKRKHKF
jgi:predicted aspartyl protease